MHVFCIVEIIKKILIDEMERVKADSATIGGKTSIKQEPNQGMTMDRLKTMLTQSIRK